MKFLERLKPPPALPELTDPEEVKRQYKYWRWRVFYSIYIGYIFFYFSRKSFTFAMPALMNDLGFTKSELGVLGSILFLTYGVSKFFSGMLADRSNPRYFMAFGLIFTGVLNICFGFSSSLLFFAVFWGLNGWFQGWGSPPCARLLTHWYSLTERGTWWGIWNSSHSVGGAIIPIMAAACAEYWGWRYAMHIPGFICILAGFFVLNRLRDTPSSLGLPSVEKFRNDYASMARDTDERDLSAKELLFRYVLSNPLLWFLAASYFFVYIIRTAVNDWTLLFLVETKGYSMLLAASCVFWFEIGGICGSLVAGWASDKIFKGRRGPINVLFCIFTLFAVLAFWASPKDAVVLDSCLMFLIGFLIFGPQMLIGMAAVELSHKKAAGTATGFVGLVAYLGAATAGYPLGKIAQDFGWEGFFVILIICAIIGSALLLPLWKVRSNPRFMKETREIEPNIATEPAQDS